jgi:hypothetical protein
MRDDSRTGDGHAGRAQAILHRRDPHGIAARATNRAEDARCISGRVVSESLDPEKLSRLA